MSSQDDTPYALVVPYGVPFGSTGHVVASMLLAESLADHGFKVSFVYFSTYYANLKEKKDALLPSPIPEESGNPSFERGNPSFSSSVLSGHGSGGPGSSRQDGICDGCRDIATAGYGSCGGGFDAGSSDTSLNSCNGSCDGTGDIATTGFGGKFEAKISGPTLNACNGSASLGRGGRGSVLIHVVEDCIKPDDVQKYFFVTPSMQENLFKLIVELQEHGSPPTCLISDSFVPWTLEIAQRVGIPRIEFWTTNAMAHLLYCNIAPLYSAGIFPIKELQVQGKQEPPLMLSHIPGLSPFPAELVPGDLRLVDSSDFFAQFFMEVASCVKHGERILVHSMAELEPNAFESFTIQGIPTYAIGPLPCRTKKQKVSHTDYMSWLDLQAKSSVIYVAFGSFARFSAQDMQELAIGLETSGSPFLWVVIEDAYRKEELPQVLPDRFFEQTRGKGLIVSWASQAEVLAHKAVGGFLSHCGWNSTLESMCVGVPMLCYPHFAEQKLNCHYLCEVWGAGLEMGRTDTCGIERSFVKLGVKALLQGEEGARARSKAHEIMHLAKKTCQPGGHSFTNLRKFYDDMRALCSRSSSHTLMKEAF